MDPKHNISVETAMDLITNEIPVINVYIQGSLIIEQLKGFNHPVIFENCIIESFSGSLTAFFKSVRFSGCILKNAVFRLVIFMVA